MSDGDNKTTFSRYVSDRIKRTVYTAALVATWTAEGICENAVNSSEFLNSNRNTGLYLRRVVAIIIKRGDYGALPESFDDVERLRGLSRRAGIEKGSDLHLQMGLMVLRAGFTGIRLSPSVLEDENLEYQLVREAMAANQFYTGKLYGLKKDQLTNLCTFMRGAVEAAYARSSAPGPVGYINSVITAIRMGLKPEIDLPPELRQKTYSPECVSAALLSLCAASVVFSKLYHLSLTPSANPQTASSEAGSASRPVKSRPVLVEKFIFVFH